jgi:hypothetical protein
MNPNRLLDWKNLIVGEITQNLHSIKADYFELFSFAFFVIGVDIFFLFQMLGARLMVVIMNLLTRQVMMAIFRRKGTMVILMLSL